MRVAVLGSSGLLGSSLVPHLRLCGHEVLSCTWISATNCRADLTDASQVVDTLNAMMPDVIVNLAALANVDECERNPHHAYMANVRIVEHLAKWIRDSGDTTHLVQLSTDQVYDGQGPHREDDLVLRNYYAFSKYAGELVAATVPSTILRTNFFGPSQCEGRASLSDWLLRSLKQEKSITVFDDVRFSPLSIQSLVRLMETVIMNRHQGIFNLGSSDGMSKADFAFTLADVMDLSTKSMRRGRSDAIKLAAYRPKDMCMDTSRFEGAFCAELPKLIEEIQSMGAAYARATR